METIFFLPFSDTSATDCFIFQSNGNVFVNKSCMLVSQRGFSGYCKPLFYLFSRHWKCIFETNPSFWLVETGCLGSRNQFFSFFQIVLAVKTFFPLVRIYFYNKSFILASGNWFSGCGNHFVPIFQIFFLLEAVFQCRKSIF